MSTDSPAPMRTSSVGRQSAEPPWFLDIIEGKTRPVEVARQHGLTVADVERWCDDFITQGSEALGDDPRDHAAQFEAREQQLLAKFGGLTLAVDTFNKAHCILGGA